MRDCCVAAVVCVVVPIPVPHIICPRWAQDNSHSGGQSALSRSGRRAGRRSEPALKGRMPVYDVAVCVTRMAAPRDRLNGSSIPCRRMSYPAACSALRNMQLRVPVMRARRSGAFIFRMAPRLFRSAVHPSNGLVASSSENRAVNAPWCGTHVAAYVSIRVVVVFPKLWHPPAGLIARTMMWTVAEPAYTNRTVSPYHLNSVACDVRGTVVVPRCCHTLRSLHVSTMVRVMVNWVWPIPAALSRLLILCSLVWCRRRCGFRSLL